jgi:uncharacterized SAM-binding protein YcdF (DUF218 family)
MAQQRQQVDIPEGRMSEEILLVTMVDPSTCVQTTAGIWTSWSWRLFRWFTHPERVILAFGTMMVVPWLVRSIPYKRWISGLGAVLLSLYLFSASPMAIALGQWSLTRFVPPDTGQSADAIVILGRGSNLQRDRADLAADLWRQKRAPLILTSGIGDAPAIVRYLETQGIPASALWGEPCSRTTAENAEFTANLLRPLGAKQIILVTDPPHMWRSLLTFQARGFTVLPHYSPLPPTLKPRTASLLVFREYPGLLAYGLLGRFSAQEPGESPSA